MAVHGAGPSGVEVVAHRGASADAPEHTLGDFRQAVLLGADAVECDVRMTRAGALVCVHDRRIDRTSTGRGVISALDLADLERFEFGRAAAVAGRRRAEPVAGMEDDERPDGPTVLDATGHPFEREDRAFADAVQGRPDRTRTTYAEALRTHRVTTAAVRFAVLGRPLAIDGDGGGRVR